MLNHKCCETKVMGKNNTAKQRPNKLKNIQMHSRLRNHKSNRVCVYSSFFLPLCQYITRDAKI